MFDRAKLKHGGNLLQAAKQSNIPLHEWLDLSTGINPNGWPVPEIPAHIWQRLPEVDDDLTAAAQNYFHCPLLLPVAGSQTAIQSLPYLRPHSKVGIISPGYAEHAAAWKRAGHKVTLIPEESINNTTIAALDVLVLINPNNPTGKVFSKSELLSWHQQLLANGGWLVIDEAFMDTTPEQSLLESVPLSGLIVLRSIGKFFGLAGIRCGFVFAEEELLVALNQYIGPWNVSNPARYIATLAMNDSQWQHNTRRELSRQTLRLTQILTEFGLAPDGKTSLFQWHKSPQAKKLYQQLLQHGILCRLFDAPDSLRFGLAINEAQWQRLSQALNQCDI